MTVTATVTPAGRPGHGVSPVMMSDPRAAGRARPRAGAVGPGSGHRRGGPVSRPGPIIESGPPPGPAASAVTPGPATR